MKMRQTNTGQWALINEKGRVIDFSSVKGQKRAKLGFERQYATTVTVEA